MSENLYAPPQADLGTGRELAMGSGDVNVGRCLSEAWANTWAHFPLWLGFGLVWTLALFASAITIIGLVLAVPVLFWGGYVFFLKMQDGGPALRDVFAGFSRYGEALGGMLAFWLLSLLLGLPGNIAVQIGASSKRAGLMLAGYAVVLGITLFVTARLNFAPFLMVDRGLGVGAAISESWGRTAELKGKLAMLTVVMFLVMFGGVLALGIGVIPGVVIAYALWPSAYRQIFGGGVRR